MIDNGAFIGPTIAAAISANIAGLSRSNLERFGDYEAIAFDGRVWSSQFLHDQACRLASAFLDLGLAPGDRVLLCLPDGPDLVIAFTAVLWSGCVAAPVFAGTSPAEIERIVGHCAPAAIVAGVPLTTRTAHGSMSIAYKIATGSVGPTGWLTLGSLTERFQPLETPVPRCAGDLALICYTSGTSGAPKAVTYTHASVSERCRPAPRREAAETILVTRPLNSAGARTLIGRLAHKWKLLLLDRFEPRAVLSAIDQHRVTVLPLVPAMAEALLAVPEIDRYDLLSLRTVTITGAAVSDSLRERLAAVLPVVPVVVYGMTEAGGGIAATQPSSKPGSVGRVLPGVQLRILDERGRDVPSGEIGDIHVRTAAMSPGYYRSPDGAADTWFSGGWLRTGDCGFLDSDSELFLIGRRRDIIIQNGVSVQPHELADVIRRLPGVHECAVVGVPHPVLGEQVVACVVVRPASTIRTQDVIRHCRAHLDPRKAPVRVRFAARIPKSATGDINVDALRQLVSARHADRAARDFM